MNELRSLLNSGFSIKASELKDILESIRSEGESKYYDQVLPYVMGSRFNIQGELVLSSIDEAQDAFRLCPKIPVCLNLFNNNIQDVSSLSELTNLTNLDLSNNNIEDISPIAELTNLTRLDISYNNIQDVSPLSELTNLTSLDLYNNNIQDISPLHHLKAEIYT